jgi:hypothetical protein
MTRVVVHIDRLVLRGFRREDRHAVATGLQEELTRVFAEPEVTSHVRTMGDVPTLGVGPVAMPAGAEPQRVGESVARGIGAEVVR